MIRRNLEIGFKTPLKEIQNETKKIKMKPFISNTAEPRPQEAMSRSTRVLQQLVNGIANGVPASYETLVRFAIEGVPYLSSEVSVKERSRKLLEEYENDVDSALRRLEEETTRGWGFVMGKTLLQIVGGVYIPYVNSVSRSFGINKYIYTGTLEFTSSTELRNFNQFGDKFGPSHS